jgi:hypothetical protein
VIVLVGKLLVYFQEYVYAESGNFSFSFESNLLVFIYLFWKCYEIKMISNYLSLLPALISLCLINTVKIYGLFDYNILYIISIFRDLGNSNP